MAQAVTLELFDVVQTISDCSAELGETQEAAAITPRLKPFLAHSQPLSCLCFGKPLFRSGFELRCNLRFHWAYLEDLTGAF